MEPRGCIQVYTGDGKGKTTAALGLALRARSHGLKVCFIYFHKNLDKWGYKEQHALKELGIDVVCFAKKHPGCDTDMTEEEVSALSDQCSEALESIRYILKNDKYDILFLDEINIAVRDGYLKEEDVIDLLKQKPQRLEIILTGRGATDNIKSHADLVSVVHNEKHPFDNKLPARKGIEF